MASMGDLLKGGIDSFLSAQSASLENSTQNPEQPSTKVEPIPIPVHLVQTSISFHPLTELMQTFAQKVATMEETMAHLQNDNARLRAEVQTCTQKYNVAQEQLAAVFHTVTTYNEELSDLKAKSMTKEESKKQFDALSYGQLQLKESILDLDNKKIDTHSSLLETRIREVSDDCCNRFLLRREREQREWVSLQVSSLETKVNHTLESTREVVTAQLQSVEEGISKKQEELRVQLGRTEAELTTKSSVQEAVDRAFVSKIECCERCLVDAKGFLLTEIDRVERSFKKFIKSFGLDWTDLDEAMQTSRINADEDVDMVNAAHDREVFSLSQTKDFSSGWKAVRSAHFQLLTHVARLSRSAQGEEPMDIEAMKKRADQTREERIRVLRQQRDAQASKTTAGVKQPLSMATRLILSSAPFVDNRNAVSETLMTRLADLKRDLADDIAMQTQALQRDLKLKVSTQRAIELIEEFATKTVATELSRIATNISELATATVSKDELSARLSTKADVTQLQHKASLDAISELEQKVREEMKGFVEGTIARLSASFEGKLKDVEESRLAKSDPVFLQTVSQLDKLVNGVHPALSKGGPQQGDGRCLSCNAVADPPPKANQPNRPIEKERLLQPTAEHHTPRQSVDLGSRPPLAHTMRRPQSAESDRHQSDFSLSAWATAADMKYNQGHHAAVRLEPSQLLVTPRGEVVVTEQLIITTPTSSATAGTVKVPQKPKSTK